jgi:hypothetical protein
MADAQMLCRFNQTFKVWQQQVALDAGNQAMQHFMNISVLEACVSRVAVAMCAQSRQKWPIRPHAWTW